MRERRGCINFYERRVEKATPIKTDLPFNGDTVIGKYVWIGQNVAIIPEGRIGDCVIITAQSAVVKEDNPYTIIDANFSKFI